MNKRNSILESLSEGMLQTANSKKRLVKVVEQNFFVIL